jgi:transcriptional regulator with XRE-family HTH domain
MIGSAAWAMPPNEKNGRPANRVTGRACCHARTTVSVVFGVATELGKHIRRIREQSGLSLREVSRRAGLHSGYLSQLERGLIEQPLPRMLERLAGAYDLPASTLMRWAGYATDAPDLTSAQAHAIQVLGPETTDEEVEVIRAVLATLRGR